jgi:hypothetical protein
MLWGVVHGSLETIDTQVFLELKACRPLMNSCIASLITGGHETVVPRLYPIKGIISSMMLFPHVCVSAIFLHRY